ncbi:MAG: endopeptidase La, partial [Firmicutes bacterium]|nr:endopeptidase La [Bacillota bacterium]
VTVIPNGSGRLELTGSLGDVMKESCRIALSYIRANSEKYGIDTDFSKVDIHIHAPEGAVPKDGPSAGITMTTALISVLSNRKVRGDVAMTGEVTLQGRVLPIGGLKEKSMAAYREGIKTVIIPFDNQSDLQNIDEKVRSEVKFIPVKNIDQAIQVNLVQ